MLMSLLELIKWWWENNVEWIRLHDPWVIPIIALSVPLSFVIKAVCAIIKLWKDE